MGDGATLDDNEEVFVVVGVRSAKDSWNGLVRKSFRLFNNSRGWTVHVWLLKVPEIYINNIESQQIPFLNKK